MILQQTYQIGAWLLKGVKSEYKAITAASQAPRAARLNRASVSCRIPLWGQARELSDFKRHGTSCRATRWMDYCRSNRWDAEQMESSRANVTLRNPVKYPPEVSWQRGRRFVR